MADIIKENFKKRAVIHSNIWMYFISTAIDVIKECKEYNIRVKGLEAFILNGKGIQPDMMHSVDYDIRNGNWDEAIQFLSDEINAAKSGACRTVILEHVAQ